MKVQPDNGLAVRSFDEVAAMLGVSQWTVRQGERSAFVKLKEHPDILKLAEEYGLILPVDEE